MHAIWYFSKGWLLVLYTMTLVGLYTCSCVCSQKGIVWNCPVDRLIIWFAHAFCFSFLLMSLHAYADLLFVPLWRVSEFSFRLMKSLHFLTVNIPTFLGAGFQVCSVCCHLLLTCPMPPTMSYPWLWETRTCRISNGILVCPRSSSISDSNRYLACRMDGTPAPHRVHVPLVVLLPLWISLTLLAVSI